MSHVIIANRKPFICIFRIDFASFVILSVIFESSCDQFTDRKKNSRSFPVNIPKKINNRMAKDKSNTHTILINISINCVNIRYLS